MKFVVRNSHLLSFVVGIQAVTIIGNYLTFRGGSAVSHDFVNNNSHPFTEKKL